jgi:serine acetyltransferase
MLASESHVSSLGIAAMSVIVREMTVRMYIVGSNAEHISIEAVSRSETGPSGLRKY